MPDLSAYRLPLPGDGVTRFDEAARLVRDEVGRSVGIDVEEDHGSAIGTHAAVVRWRTSAAADSDDRVWTLLWETPFTGGPDTSWAMTVKVALDTGQASVIVRLGVVTRGFRMTPVHLGLEPPPLVLTLLKTLGAREDGQVLDGEPCYASDRDDGEHLAELLLDPGRVLPVVVISSGDRAPDRAPGPLIEPGPVARSLASIAHVVVLDSTNASRAVTEIIGPQLTVFGGAVRLYWPALTVTSAQRDHRLWLPRLLDDRREPTLRQELFSQLMPLAVVRFSSAALEARITRTIERQRRAEIRRLSARAEEASLAVDWKQELETAWSENERLREAYDGLTGQLAAAHENLRTVTARWATDLAIDAGPPSAPEPPDEPSSVLEAVEWAADRCAGLVFLDDARESARRATYRQPARVLRALLAMDRAVLAWQQDQLDGGFRNVLADQGVDYGHGLSTATLGRFPHEYKRTYRGKRIELGPHVRLGRGSPEACCRIYFYLDEDARLCVVGHVGNHLSDRTTG